MRDEDGITLVEVLIAALVLTVGIVALIGAFANGRKLTLLSERRTAMVHRAQLELERLQTYPYGELAMIAEPAHSTEASNPDYYITAGAPSSYQYGGSKEEAELLVVGSAHKECTSTSEAEAKSGCGIVEASPTGRACSKNVGACEWSNGAVTGKIYDFITLHTDSTCAKCLTKEFKRLTVVVTVKVPAGTREPAPVRISTLIAEPSTVS